VGVFIVVVVVAVVVVVVLVLVVCVRVLATRRHRALLIKAGVFAMPQPSFELEPKALHLLRLVSLDVPDYMHVVTCLGAITH
jgi:hypothetical protein